MTIDLDDIADLPTPVGTVGTLHGTEASGDEIFEYTIGVVIIVSGARGG